MSFTVTNEQAEHHYTLYYYDHAGNLLRTVPPEGVHPEYGSTFLNNVRTARATNGSAVVPEGEWKNLKKGTDNFKELIELIEEQAEKKRCVKKKSLVYVRVDDFGTGPE